LTLGQAYLSGDVTVDGDIEFVHGLLDAFLTRVEGGSGHIRDGGFVSAEPVHSPDRDARAIAFHYDQSNAAFALITGRTRVYSCACFASPDDDLDAAQVRKLDRVCRKLELEPEQRLLDIGCGWGGLLLHAAATYGARATGITISSAQANAVVERLATEP